MNAMQDGKGMITRTSAVNRTDASGGTEKAWQFRTSRFWVWAESHGVLCLWMGTGQWVPALFIEYLDFGERSDNQRFP